MNILKKKLKKFKNLSVQAFFVFTSSKGKFYTLEMQLLCLRNSYQDSFLHMKPTIYDVGRGHTCKFELKPLFLSFLRVPKMGIFNNFEGFLTLLCTGGGHLVPPPKVLVSGAFQSDLRDPRCWHKSYMIMRIDFMKKKIQNFFKFFSIFFSFLDTLNKQKDIFALWGQK